MARASEFVLICEGPFDDANEALRALQEPFIEEFTEESGRFRFHDLPNILVAGGITLGDLEVTEIDEDLFEVSCRNSPIILKRQKADELAEALRRQAIFDEIEVKAADDVEEPGETGSESPD